MPSRPTYEGVEARQAGFALIEVLVGLAILALVLAVLFSVFSDGVGRASHGEKQASALQRAQSMLAVVGSEIPVRPGSTSGQFDDGSRWRLSIVAHGDAADRRAWPVAAYDVSVEVAWTDGAQVRALTLDTLRLGPKEGAR